METRRRGLLQMARELPDRRDLDPVAFARVAERLVQDYEPEAALKLLDALPEAARSLPLVLKARVRALRALGRDEEAAPDDERLIALLPEDDDYRQRREIERAARERDLEGVIARCDIILARDPWDFAALYHKAHACAGSGRGAQAREIMRLDQLVDVGNLALPPGFASMPDFCAAIANEVLGNPTLRHDPTKATLGGRQTSRLLYPGADTLAVLLDAIRSHVDDHVARLIAAAEPFAISRPERASLFAWGVVYDDHGKQISHWHPDGWLSGVFYVDAPRGSDGRRQGSLLVGSTGDDEVDVNLPWKVREIEPEPGRVVLFPSFVPHATRPAEIGGRRISVAFDVIPA